MFGIRSEVTKCSSEREEKKSTIMKERAVE
jgi:hypothetical protein